MPAPRIQLLLITKGTQTQLDLAKTAAETELTRRTIANRPHHWVDSTDDTTGRRKSICHARYSTRAGGDFVWGELQTLAATLIANVTGSISYHQCPHDEGTLYDCQNDARAGYVAVTL